MVPEHQHGPVRRVIFRAESQEILQGLRRTHICVGQRVHHLQGIPRVHIPPQLPGLHRRVGPFVAAAGFNHHGHVLRQGNLFHFHEVACGRLILALQVRAAQIPVDRPALPLGVVRRLICRQSTVRLLRLLLRAARKGKDQANCQQKRDPSLRLHSYKPPFCERHRRGYETWMLSLIKFVCYGMFAHIDQLDKRNNTSTKLHNSQTSNPL